MKTTTLALITLAALATGAAAADLKQPASSAGLDDVKRAELAVAHQSWPAAVDAYKAAIAASPKDPVLRNRIGICYQRMGDAGAARVAYRQAISLDGRYAEAYNNLGTLDHARGKFKQAINAYSKAIQLQPQHAVFHKNLGTAWLARGDVEKALESWNEAYRLDPMAFEGDATKVPGGGVDLATQYFLLAKLLASRGELEKALDYLTKAQAAGFAEFAKVEKDSAFAAIVKDPRYAALK